MIFVEIQDIEKYFAFFHGSSRKIADKRRFHRADEAVSNQKSRRPGSEAGLWQARKCDLFRVEVEPGRSGDRHPDQYQHIDAEIRPRIIALVDVERTDGVANQEDPADQRQRIENAQAKIGPGRKRPVFTRQMIVHDNIPFYQICGIR